MGIFLKDPAAALDYAIDWAAIAGAAGLNASSWTVAPAQDGGLTVVAEAVSGSRCAATVEGGHPGMVYRLTNQVTWSDGRRDARSLDVRVERR
ncbi:hypothetical protein J2Y54_001672 [Sphingomonas sp. BE123]|jgi:hypothetical protein|uniref:phage fiber-tail adaptor protein n=1 Tax=unclassified Sphingomonas TaxID=196159 RepID=UPI002855D548|nr:hypothetical protein [Sphingomonas sp. BE123]MDR6852152.1 hypothetical protein [Sphingomonas sp. BE123]